MLKEKKTIKEKDTLFPIEDNDITTIEDIEQKISANQATIDQSKTAIKYAQDELETIQDRRQHRERHIGLKQTELQDATEALNAVRTLAEEASMSKAIELSKRLSEARTHFDSLQTELENMQRANFTAIQDESVREVE